MSPPFMPLYVGDYFADTVHLNGAESGAYLHLIMCMWRAGGSLPSDPAKLARFCKLTVAQWDRVSVPVLEFFTVADGVISQARLSRELAKYEVGLIRRVERASAGGKAKALKTQESALLKAPSKRANQNQNHKEYPSSNDEGVRETKPKGAKRCPEGWTIPPDLVVELTVAAYSPGQIERELARFRSYEFKRPHVDWPDTFREWMEKKRPDGRTTSAAPESFAERDSRRRRENLERSFAASESVVDLAKRRRGEGPNSGSSGALG